MNFEHGDSQPAGQDPNPRGQHNSLPQVPYVSEGAETPAPSDPAAAAVDDGASAAEDAPSPVDAAGAAGHEPLAQAADRPLSSPPAQVVFPSGALPHESEKAKTTQLHGDSAHETERPSPATASSEGQEADTGSEPDPSTPYERQRHHTEELPATTPSGEGVYSPPVEASSQGTTPVEPAVRDTFPSEPNGGDLRAQPAPSSPPALPPEDSSAVSQRQAPDPSTVEAFHQAALLQRALINNGEMIAVKNVFEQTLDTHAPISAGYLDVVREVYAELHTKLDRGYSGENERSTFDDAFSLLRPAGSVLVLSRPSGTSRNITAYALMARLLNDGLIKEVWPLSFGSASIFPAKRLPREHHRGYVLELPPDEDDFEIHNSFGANLKDVQEHLRPRNSRLIVITTPDQWRRIGRGAPDGVAPDLGAARPADVAERWLHAEEPSFPITAWLRNPQMSALLDGQSPTEVLHIVDLMREERRTASRTIANEATGLDALQRRAETADTDGAIAKQVANVAAARNNWEEELYTWHEQRDRTSFQRNFLVTAAVLRGAPVGHIYAKAADLCKLLEGDDVKVTGQQAPGVISMTRAIHADRTKEGVLSFQRPHWDDAALEYFWTDRPLARVPFLEWLAQAPLDEPKVAMESVGIDDRRALAERVGDFAVRWAVRHRRQEPLQEIVTEWHEQRAKGLWPLAISLLDDAAIHPASAPYIHTMLRAWGRRKTEVALPLAVVSVCAGKFGRTHTGKALRRLRDAAESEHSEVADALQAAVRTLWADDSVRPLLFKDIVGWCGNAKIKETVGRQTFAALATTTHPNSDGIPLILGNPNSGDEEGFRPSSEGLVKGWRTLLAEGPGPTGARQVDTAVFLWLDAALRNPPLKSLILDSLRKAVDVRGTEEGRVLRETLRACAHGWVQGEDRPFSEEREAVRQELGALLDEDLYAAVQEQEDPDPSGDGVRSKGTDTE